MTLADMFDPADYVLTDAEFEAVYSWLNREKDHFTGDLGEGLLKLINGEEDRRMFGPREAGRVLGSIKTEAKAQAARANGRLGGRPRNKPADVKIGP